MHSSVCMELMVAVSDVAKQKFGDVPEGDIRQAIRQKCSNAVKALKLQGLKTLMSIINFSVMLN